MPGQGDGKMDLDRLAERVAGGHEPEPEELRGLLHWPLERVGELARAALAIKERAFPGSVEFCAIVNAKSGSCSEEDRKSVV